MPACMHQIPVHLGLCRAGTRSSCEFLYDPYPSEHHTSPLVPLLVQGLSRGWGQTGPLSSSPSLSVSLPSEPGSSPLSNLPSFSHGQSLHRVLPLGAAVCCCCSPGIISLKEERGLPQGHAGGRKQSWDLNPGSLAPESRLFNQLKKPPVNSLKLIHHQPRALHRYYFF